MLGGQIGGGDLLDVLGGQLTARVRVYGDQLAFAEHQCIEARLRIQGP